MNFHMMTGKNTKIEALIARAADTIASVAPTMPTLDEVNEVAKHGYRAGERGYFLPDEDEATRRIFADYLTRRAALLSMLEELRPEALAELKQPQPRHPEIFIVAYCAACLLVRSGRFVIDSFSDQPVIRDKLNEAEPRFGIPRKQFTRIYRSLTSPAKIWIFLEATRYWRENRARLIEQFQSDPAVQPILEVLIGEEPWIETSKRYYAGRHLKYRVHSFVRRNHSGYKNVTFALFKASGSLIAELRMKWKRKRVTPGVQRKIAKLLQPGDVIITRHDDATSNLFLPGFWPHGALYIGTKSQRDELGINAPEDKRQRCNDPICVLEARKDGVLFRQLSDTLDVDACTVIRPKLNAEQLRESINARSYA